MKVNYKLVLDKIIEEIKVNDYVPTLLLHACCAPCSSSVLEYLSNYFKITIVYYNPNISLYEEYEKRLNEIKRLVSTMNLKYKVDIMPCDYDNDVYEDIIKGLEKEPEGGNRCLKCYRLRLQKTASLARKNKFDYFTTTLTISPYKNSKVLNEIGADLEKEYNVKYLYSDFKKNDGYKRSIELSKEYNLYRQDYCGCIYSKKK
ncbi:MAG: epoxyqueuosine reductase QueH [Clostridium sp.]|nr:epoxyqueuosine reductase QueH [Clostridium sp.]MCM1444739.1 epoxyqueuosine reductase QueH [Candidatus Amulumruptor caecigallinarius]